MKVFRIGEMSGERKESYESCITKSDKEISQPQQKGS